MSNSAPDYEDNIVFQPQEIKSQHELSEQGRQSEVLIKAIEKCEKLEIELGIVLNILLRECPQYEGYVKANFPSYKRS